MKIQKIILFLLLSLVTVGILILLIYNNIYRYQDANYINEKAQELKNTCSKADSTCYVEPFGALTKKYPLQFVLKVLDRLQTIDPKAIGCHRIAHKIVAVEVEKNPSKWKEIMLEVSPNYCSNGFMHGAIEAHARFDPSFTIDENTISELCNFVKNSTKIIESDESCAHAMGHVLLTENYGNIQKAIEACRKAPLELAYYCYGGVFMENFKRENLVAHGIADKIPLNEETIKNIFEELCNRHQDSEGTACWAEMVHLYISYMFTSPEKVFEDCNRAPTKPFRDACILHSVPLLILYDKLSKDQMKGLCQPFANDNNRYIECISDAVWGLVYNSTKTMGRVVTYCSILEDSFQQTCYEETGKYLLTLVTKRRQQELCRQVPEKFLKACNNGTTQ